MEISRNLSEQPFPTDSERITLKNYLRDYVHQEILGCWFLFAGFTVLRLLEGGV